MDILSIVTIHLVQDQISIHIYMKSKVLTKPYHNRMHKYFKGPSQLLLIITTSKHLKTNYKELCNYKQRSRLGPLWVFKPKSQA